MAAGCNDRQQQHCATRRICNLREGETDLAQLTVEESCAALELGGTGAIDMTQLMQHCPLLGENQQKRECKSEANPTHFNGEFQVQSRLILPQGLSTPDNAAAA